MMAVGWTLAGGSVASFLENPFSISSRLRPLVSGRMVRANTAPKLEATANVHMNHSIPTIGCRLGYILMVANVNICTILVVMPPKDPLNLSG